MEAASYDVCGATDVRRSQNSGAVVKFRILYDVRYANGCTVIRASNEEEALNIFARMSIPTLVEDTDDVHVEVESVEEINGPK